MHAAAAHRDCGAHVRTNRWIVHLFHQIEGPVFFLYYGQTNNAHRKQMRRGHEEIIPRGIHLPPCGGKIALELGCRELPTANSVEFVHLRREQRHDILPRALRRPGKLRQDAARRVSHQQPCTCMPLCRGREMRVLMQVFCWHARQQEIRWGCRTWQVEPMTVDSLKSYLSGRSPASCSPFISARKKLSLLGGTWAPNAS